MSVNVWHKIVLSLGSNYGDRSASIMEAIGFVSLIGVKDICCSEIYETPDARGKGLPYCNMVAVCFTRMELSELVSTFKDYECRAGRTRQLRQQGNVPIDIDVVIYDEEILRPKDYRQNFFQIGYQSLASDAESSQSIAQVLCSL